MRRYKENALQIRCVTWFRYQYPHYAKLLFHVKNEGGRGTNSRTGGIAKAEGVVSGVADLILSVPAMYIRSEEGEGGILCCSPSLAIEMKTQNGRQSSAQKEFERYFNAMGGIYAVVRSYEAFKEIVMDYMNHVTDTIDSELREVKRKIDEEKRIRAEQAWKGKKEE